MGLTAWKGGVVRKTDATIAKNYLAQDEISELNRIVTMWLDFAEDQTRRRKQVFLCDWATKLRELHPEAASIFKDSFPILDALRPELSWIDYRTLLRIKDVLGILI